MHDNAPLPRHPKSLIVGSLVKESCYTPFQRSFQNLIYANSESAMLTTGITQGRKAFLENMRQEVGQVCGVQAELSRPQSCLLLRRLFEWES